MTHQHTLPYIRPYIIQVYLGTHSTILTRTNTNTYIVHYSLQLLPIYHIDPSTSSSTCTTKLPCTYIPIYKEIISTLLYSHLPIYLYANNYMVHYHTYVHHPQAHVHALHSHTQLGMRPPTHPSIYKEMKAFFGNVFRSTLSSSSSFYSFNVFKSNNILFLRLSFFFSFFHQLNKTIQFQAKSLRRQSWINNLQTVKIDSFDRSIGMGEIRMLGMSLKMASCFTLTNSSQT